MSTKKHQLLLGAHMSIAGGPDKAIERGESIDCTAIQIFTKSNRQWKAKPLTHDVIEAFKERKKNSSIKSIIAHASYLINVGSSTRSVVHQSIDALENELVRCDQLGIKYLVLHPGSAGTQSSRQEAIDRIAHGINKVFSRNTSHAHILLELMAGQGSVIGRTFQELAEIRAKITDKQRIEFCFDTCHAYAAGYDFSTPSTYKAMWDDFDKHIGFGRLKAIHLNDSKKERGSNVDRHEHIGKGTIGLEAFKLLMNDERFFDIPKVLETPKDDNDLREDAMNMKTLIDLLTEKNKKKLL